jgi:hypothetical protein
MSDQRKLASDLAEEMRECGHEVYTADVLDCLATLGIELSESFANPAAQAYADLIEEGIANQRKEREE